MLSGYRFDAQGGVTALSKEEILRLPKRPAEFVWIDVQGTQEHDLEVLWRVFQFHPLAIEDCLAVQHHPKIDEYEDHAFLIFREIDFQLSKGKVRTAKLACFLGESFLVTFHRNKLKSVDSVRERCLKDERFGQRGPDSLLHAILDKMVDLYFPELEEFEKAIDAAQDDVLRKPTQAVLQRILDLKRNILHLRRFAGPQREVLNRLARGDSRYIRPANAIYFRDIFDHTFRISDAIDAHRDVLTGVMETYLSMVSNKLNEVMKVLTLITTIIMPISFIASVYGMNFKNMPEIEWQYGYFFALVLMAGVAVGMWLWFRRKGWF